MGPNRQPTFFSKLFWLALLVGIVPLGIQGTLWLGLEPSPEALRGFLIAAAVGIGLLLLAGLSVLILYIDNRENHLDAVRKTIGDYTREAGVRQLERLIGAICRKAIVKLTTKTWEHVMITPEVVSDYLKKEKFESEVSETIDVPGISTGLAVTSVGGDILFVEATRMEGNGKLTVTGQLGDVMKESASIAHSYVRSKSRNLEIEPQAFKASDVHLHVPAGAIPKDGPSAGIAMVLAQASLYSNRVVRSNVGMTGEVTLRGRVLPVGGIKMKILAAHRAGLKTVILPKRNEKDLEDVPTEVRNTMDFVLVDRIDEAIEAALLPTKDSSDVADSHFDGILSRPEIEFSPVSFHASNLGKEPAGRPGRPHNALKVINVNSGCQPG